MRKIKREIELKTMSILLVICTISYLFLMTMLSLVPILDRYEDVMKVLLLNLWDIL